MRKMYIYKNLRTMKFTKISLLTIICFIDPA